MNTPRYLIIDFDSTFTRVEALDELCKISLQGNHNQEVILTQIQEITNRGMEGKLSLRQSLKERILLLHAHKNHLGLLIEALKKQVTQSFIRNIAFLEENRERIYILSSGFREFILPVVADYGIKSSHVLANTFVFDAQGNIIGFDEANVLSEDQGKVKKMAELNLKGEVNVIGDGFTDYEIRAMGKADRFFAFTENVSRAGVTAKADYIASNFDDVLTIITND